jgi:hypothetical protein
VIRPFSNSICEIFGKLIPISIALMMGAYAAILWIQSREDPGMRELAKKMIILAAVGLILIRLARPMVKTVFGVDICP